MALKEFTYRGKTMQELLAMSLDDFSKLTTSRARRSLKRGAAKKFYTKMTELKEKYATKKDYKPIRTHDRDVVIIPKMVGLRLAVYTGKEFAPVDVKQEMLGHYLGEYALTRKKIKHGKAGIGATKSSTAITAR